MKAIVVIPARSGSKRIPNKNFLDIFGSPMVKRAESLAESTKLFEKIIISLDSKEKGELFQNEQTIVHMRSNSLASDDAKTIDVVKEVIERNVFERNQPVCCLYPGSFLLGTNRIIEGLQLSCANPGRFIFTAQPVHANPIRSFRVNKESGELSFLDLPSLQQNTQKLDQFYTDAGQFYWASAETWVRNETIINDQSIPLILNRWESIDLDYPEDLEVALALQLFRTRTNG